jgi:type IV secretory pathway VirB10-like protein
MQAREMPEGPKKNIFATLGESTAVGATIIAARRAKRATPTSAPPSVVAAVPPPAPPLPVIPAVPPPAAPPPVVAAVPPPAPPGPTPEELAEQAARQQEELKRKQLREQMSQYRYLGYLSQQGVQKAFVGKGKDIYIIRKGDTLDGKFLVAAIDPSIVKLREPSTSLETSLEIKKDGDRGPS